MYIPILLYKHKADGNIVKKTTCHLHRIASKGVYHPYFLGGWRGAKMWNENCFFYRDFKNYSKQMVVFCENDNLSVLPQYLYRLHFVSNRLRYNINKTSTVLYCRFRRCLGLFSGCNKRKNLIQSQKLRAFLALLTVCTFLCWSAGIYRKDWEIIEQKAIQYVFMECYH